MTAGSLSLVGALPFLNSRYIMLPVTRRVIIEMIAPITKDFGMKLITTVLEGGGF